MAEDTPLPVTTEEGHLMTLDDAVKLVMLDNKVKVLSAKTEVSEGKKIHVVKILTPDGWIQNIRIDAANGKFIETPKK